MNKKFLLIPFVALICLIALIISRFMNESEPGTIIISGNIELTEVKLSFKIPGRVVKRFVSEGQNVQAGALVAKIDSEELRQELKMNEAEMEAAQAYLKELQVGYLPEEVSQSEARLKQAQADFDRLNADYSRQKQLYDEDVISHREFDLSQAAFAVSQAKVLEAKENLTLLKKGIREEKIAQAKARLKKAEEATSLAETRLSFANLTSPISGFVLQDYIEEGEFVQPGTPIISIGNLDEVYLKAYIDEVDLGRVKLGQKVKITTDSYPDKTYEGVVSFIAQEAEFTPKNVQTEKQRVKLVYRIKVDVENKKHELKGGQPADGLIIVVPKPNEP